MTNKILDYVKNILFPPHCVFCGEVLENKRWEIGICDACEADIPFLTKNTCPHCGSPSEDGRVCGFCEAMLPVYEKGYAVFAYEDLREEIARLKFRNDTYGVKPLSRLIVRYLKEYQEELLEWTDVMTEVPLHPRKQKERGFNQVSLLCEEIQRMTPIVYESGILERTQDTMPQNSLGIAERQKNMEGAFRARPCENKRVLLVDDIMTTGATTQACAKALYRAGAKEVRVLCLTST